MNDAPPPLSQWARELLSVPGLIAGPALPAVPVAPGRGRTVIVFPGYLTGDVSSLRLRRSLTAANYRAHGWGLGRNRGARTDLLERLAERLGGVLPDGEKAALVGWSLGGIYARELAKLAPDRTEMVITLGTPFSGSARANNAWRLYEWLNDHQVDDPPIAIDRAAKPPVPTYAVWSPNDGIVAAPSARGLAGEADERFEIASGHLAMVRSRAGIETVGRILASRWR